MVSSLEFAIRVRPLLPQEPENVGLNVNSNGGVCVGNQCLFTADHALAPSESQALVFERLSGSVKKFLEGCDVSFVAYGRSKSGKTFSLVGPPPCPGSPDVLPDSSGILPRVAHHMFKYLEKAQLSSSGFNFEVYFSFFEAPSDDIVTDGLPFQRPSSDSPVNNNFTTNQPFVRSNVRSFQEVMQQLQMVMETYPQPTNHATTNCFFTLTLHQHLMQAGKMYARSSRCFFVELGSYEPNYYYGFGYQHINVPNSGLELVCRVLTCIAEESKSSSQKPPSSVLAAALKEILKTSSKTVLMFCVSPCLVDSSNSLTDLQMLNQLRLLYGSHNFEMKCPSKDVKTTSHDDLCKEDALSLEFAASQWQLLVSNAECLFQKLVQGEIPADAKGQIEQWLFLKQECEDCFKQDSPGPEKTKCSLDRIDEVTESDGRTSLENSEESEPENDDDAVDDDEDDGDDDGLDESHRSYLAYAQSDSDKQEFTEKLESYLERFRIVTDELVSDASDAKPQRLFNDPKANEGKRLSLQRKAASVESLLTPAKEKVATSSKEDKQIMVQSEVSERSSNFERIASPDDGVFRSGDMLRVEIESLRTTKDYLVEQKRELNAKMNETKYITNEDQRKLIEADEAIDAIDSAMEFKNEMLCGRLRLAKMDTDERGERMLTDRLLNLSPNEMRVLLCKYFKKVVDLREAGRKMEKVIADQDHQLEIQNFKISALTTTVQHTRDEWEKRMFMVLKEREKKYQLNFHHFAAESSGASSSTDNRSDNQSATTTTSTSTNTGPLFEIGGGPPIPASDKALTTIPQQNLKKLQGSSTQTTKVTRKPNKLIIQQERSKKK